MYHNVPSIPKKYRTWKTTGDALIYPKHIVFIKDIYNRQSPHLMNYPYDNPYDLYMIIPMHNILCMTYPYDVCSKKD